MVRTTDQYLSWAARMASSVKDTTPPRWVVSPSSSSSVGGDKRRSSPSNLQTTNINCDKEELAAKQLFVPKLCEHAGNGFHVWQETCKHWALMLDASRCNYATFLAGEKIYKGANKFRRTNMYKWLYRHSTMQLKLSCKPSNMLSWNSIMIKIKFYYDKVF